MRGFIVLGQGFYSLNIPAVEEQKSLEHVGLLQIVSGEASVAKIEDELKNLVDDKWEWKVRKISDSEYVVVFPSKDILNAFSKSKGIELALHSISAKVFISKVDPEASSLLQTG